jgi:chemotaxis methyl-accepting protein methylase
VAAPKKDRGHDAVEGPAVDADLPHRRQLDATLPAIFELLRGHNGHDFKGYRESTIRRRLARRIRVNALSSPEDYVRLLQTRPRELDALFQELLIGVTRFFRDPDAFAALGDQLDRIIRRQGEQAALRVWVPGCASGEEAYSIAMLAIEQAERASKQLDLQVFATDPDPRAIAVARRGRYPSAIEADVSAQRLERFFLAGNGDFRVGKQVRDSVVFAAHDILRDPPFVRLDLLSSRNLLIYLKPDLQQRVLPVFHYALGPGALLWLGTSETLTGLGEAFCVVDRKWRIYQRLDRTASRVSPARVPLGWLDRRGTPLPQSPAALLPPLDSTPQLQKLDEELRSTQEELSISQQELGALHEAVQAVSHELERVQVELARHVDDMQNVLKNAGLAALFVDTGLRIRGVSEQVGRVVPLLASDVGSPIRDLASRLGYAALAEDAETVLRTLLPHDEEVSTPDGRRLGVRITAYQTASNQIEGLTITFLRRERSIGPVRPHPTE